MFNPDSYQIRRRKIREKISKGLILLIGNTESPANYKGNPYVFRQDSTFLYLTGVDIPGFVLTIDAETGNETLYGHEATADDIIWSGSQPSIKELAERAGINEGLKLSKLDDTINTALNYGRPIHILPPYRSDIYLLLEKFLSVHHSKLQNLASVELINAIARLRSIKEDQEIAEIERMVDVAYDMHVWNMKNMIPGKSEKEQAGFLEGIARSKGGFSPFPIILSIHGEILHNPSYSNILVDGRMCLTDAGAESNMHYASDITRTIPVSGVFSSSQKDIYSIVLKAQEESIRMIKPGVANKNIHLAAAKIITEGLHSLGIMRGNCDDSVILGAHAIFFPHGIGHHLGLDAHDMEALGEDYVGYNEEFIRSTQFGLSSLRLARKLEPGNVITCEPGIYFIPELITKWQTEKKFEEYINYDILQNYLQFGGIRIEDNILVTSDGSRILGKPIPKSITDIEEVMKSGKTNA
jgi:Xaa-Pro aminopeptidase